MVGCALFFPGDPTYVAISVIAFAAFSLCRTKRPLHGSGALELVYREEFSSSPFCCDG